MSNDDGWVWWVGAFQIPGWVGSKRLGGGVYYRTSCTIFWGFESAWVDSGSSCVVGKRVHLSGLRDGTGSAWSSCFLRNLLLERK